MSCPGCGHEAGNYPLGSTGCERTGGCHAVISLDDLDEHDLLAVVRAMTHVKRARFFEELEDEFCLHCGGSAGCRCWDDE